MRRERILMLSAAIFFLGTGFSPFREEDPDISKGNAAYRDKKYGDAVTAYEHAIPRAKSGDSNGEDAVVEFDRGAALAQKGDVGKARDSFLRALAGKEPRMRSSAHYNLGNLSIKEGKLEDAIAEYRRALKADPRDALAKHNLEMALLSKKKQEQQKKDQPSQDSNDPQKDKKKQEKDKSKKKESKKKDDAKKKNDAQKDEKQKDQKKEAKKEGKDKAQQKPDEKEAKKQQEKQDQRGKPDEKKNGEPKPQPAQAKNEKDQRERDEQMLKALRAGEKPMPMQQLMLRRVRPRSVDKDW